MDKAELYDETFFSQQETSCGKVQIVYAAKSHILPDNMRVVTRVEDTEFIKNYEKHEKCEKLKPWQIWRGFE